MSKIKILVISNDFDGIGYYRINSPYLSINDPDLDIRFLPYSDFTFDWSENNIYEVDIIIFHKILPINNEAVAKEFFKIRQKYNMQVVFDIDDYWFLDKTHVNYADYVKSKTTETAINNLNFANYITTTTPIFAEKIKEINPNVVVLENAVNTKEHQWIPDKVKSDKTRFIWGGGITHLPDIRLLEHTFKELEDDFINKTQLYMCGFDLRMRKPDGSIKMDIPKYSKWTNFENIFSNRYRSVKNPEYLKWLKEYTDIERTLYGYNEQFKDEFYQRRWSKPIFTYGTMYNEADVALAPLKEFEFNMYKSQLKVIEAGIHYCPVIASNFGPYTIDIVDGKNGFLIDNENKPEWYKKMKFFVNNPNAVEDMGNALHELVMEKYTLDVVNKKRIEFLKSIV
jgi:glycosyltransferase involved in cell wall biosynthesis